MGNNSTCKIVGVGTVRIIMFDSVILTLNDERYVPKLRLNLILLSCLDTNVCRVSMSKGVLKVNKGSSLIMNRQKNLNMLEGHIVVGAAAVSNSEKDMDNT